MVGAVEADLLGRISHELDGALRLEAARHRDADRLGEHRDAGGVVVGARRDAARSVTDVASRPCRVPCPPRITYSPGRLEPGMVRMTDGCGRDAAGENISTVTSGRPAASAAHWSRIQFADW
ncbi:MAG: hypothetical protein M5U09_09305 [Gammaproteobacteria bacterium]|nr:hypothetical protein [Gammaproteobacteria bacterium]